MDELKSRLEDLLRDHLNYLAMSALEMEAYNDPVRSRTVADAYAKKAIELERRISTQPDDLDMGDVVGAATLAARAVHLAGGIQERRALLDSIGPEGAASLMRALSYDIGDLLSIAHGSTTWRDERDRAGRLLLDAAMVVSAS